MMDSVTPMDCLNDFSISKENDLEEGEVEDGELVDEDDKMLGTVSPYYYLKP